MDEVIQRLNINPETQQSSESFANNCLDGAFDVPSFLGVHIREQAETPRQGAGDDHGTIGNGQSNPVPVPSASSPLTDTQVDAIGANSTIR